MLWVLNRPRPTVARLHSNGYRTRQASPQASEAAEKHFGSPQVPCVVIKTNGDPLPRGWGGLCVCVWPEVARLLRGSCVQRLLLMLFLEGSRRLSGFKSPI